jgi:hypothetical protein
MSSTTFLRELPLVTARRYADAELSRKATPDQLAWLHAHPLLWLRALTQVRRDVENHIAKARAGIAHLKPAQGGPLAGEQMQAWSIARREVETESLRRLHFIRVVDKRKEEVKSLIGSNPFDLSVGDAVDIMLKLAELAREDDMEAVIDMATHLAKRWAKLDVP